MLSIWHYLCRWAIDGYLLGIIPSQRAPHARQRRRPMHSWVSVAITHLFSRAQIPIAPAARPRATSRGFLPWRLSDAGPSLGVRGSVRHRPASETLHSLRLRTPIELEPVFS